ncbi:MAG: FHA domain-containing protein, partial [Proteobacteria bacterium]|nr:FHA domain-containing protein [Pseudomonadota bacterium]
MRDDESTVLHSGALDDVVDASAVHGRYLLVVDSRGSRRVPLPEHGKLGIGRALDADVYLADDSTSRQHAELELSADAALLIDLGSQNGTRVGGVRVTGSRVLHSGDIISIGACTVVFHTSLATLAVVCSNPRDEDWVRRAIDGSLIVVAEAPADAMVISADCLAAIADHLPGDQQRLLDAAVVVIGDPTTDYPRAAHVVTREWPAEHLRTLLVALAERKPVPPTPLASPTTPSEARDAQRTVAAARKLGAATDLSTTETTIVEILIELIDVDRAYCLFYDADAAALWSEAKINSKAGDDRRAVTGLAGFAARTGVAAIANIVGDDPRFVGAIDDPNGDLKDHLIAQPVLGSDGGVHAVLVVVRRGRRPAFGPADVGLLGRFAQVAAPVLDQLSIHVHSQEILDETSDEDGIFRRQARQAQGMSRWGDVVRVSPGWVSWAYWLLVVLVAASVVFVIVGSVSTYSSGPALIRSTARTPISARAGGNVLSVPVAPGDHVELGAVIVRLDDTDQRATVARLDHEFETQLRNHMLDPGDAAVDGSLRNLRHELDTAHTAVDERLIHAPVAGVVGDVRVRSSQHLDPGDIVASIVDSTEGLEVIALLPGEDRPQLAPGMTIRLELTGYRYLYQSFTIDSVSSEVLAPNEARRVLGA